MPRTSTDNGKFDLFYRRGWAFLAVYPPVGTGMPVYPEEIENRMKLLGIPRVSAKTIRDLIEAAGGTAIPLVEWPGGRNLASAVSVDIASDGMSASITIQAPKKGASPPLLSDILEELDHAGVVYGIDKDCIQGILDRQAYGKPVPVAAGTNPVSGRSHRIVHHFNTTRGKPWLEMDFGRINLKELNFIENCHKGDLLAELEPPVAAVDGRKVTGDAITASTDSEVVQLAAGPNTVLSPERDKLHADCDGNVRIADGKILVESVITIKNVNYETGNIRFDGSVVVEGSVADGFIVEAGGDLQVASSVGKATLKAAGSILLKTGINGNGEGRIDCGGDLLAKYIESCTVNCRGNVLVEEAIMHSRVTAFRHCVLNGRRSEVIASELVVGDSFWCKKLGNFNEAVTRLAVGVEPRLLFDYRATAAAIREKQEEWDRIELQLEQLGKLIKDGRTAEHGDTRVQLAWTQQQAALDRLGMEIAGLRNQFPNLRDRLLPSRSSIAVIEETMFKGASVMFGTLEYRAPDAGIRRTILRAGENQILESGFNYNERPVLVFDAPAPPLDAAARVD